MYPYGVGLMPYVYVMQPNVPQVYHVVNPQQNVVVQQMPVAVYQPPPHLPPQPQVEYLVDVYFKYNRSCLYRSQFEVVPGTHVIVEGDRGQHIGIGATCRPCVTIPDYTRSVVRMASEEEEAVSRANAEEEQDAIHKAQAVLDKHGINIRIYGAEFQLDRKKLTFYIARGRDAVLPQFKPVLGELYSIWKCRVWFTV